MFKWFAKLFNKEIQKCEHGWVIEDPNKLPIKRTSSGFSVCPDCALNSSLQQLGCGTVLTKEDADTLREAIQKERT